MHVGGRKVAKVLPKILLQEAIFNDMKIKLIIISYVSSFLPTHLNAQGNRAILRWECNNLFITPQSYS